MAQTLDQIIADRAALFDPSKALVNSQTAALPGQQAAEQGGLDTAKTNAFGDITNSANAKGVLFSGVPVDQQARYVGEKYLPAKAALDTTYANKRSALEQTLLDIGQKQSTDASSVQNGQISAEAAAQKTADDRAYNESRLQIAAAKAASTAASKVVDPAKGYNLARDKGGGLQFTGPNSRPVTAAQYASVTGTNIRDLLSSSGNPGDQEIIKAIDSGMSYGNLAKKYPYVFGGV